ncbi:MAG TPA: branched-chain amino acid ABC transporter permease, partial [Chloroflexota bacterium]|nr:branched-chain amino acid ABC transporter permease [Chloroflexota bacterium]
VYGIIELINFAHGDVFIFGAFISIPVIDAVINQATGSPTVLQSILAIGLSMMAAATACAILGVFIERVAYRRLRNAPRLAPLITAIGVSLILENAMFQWQGGLPVFYPVVLLTSNYPFLGTVISNRQIIIMASAVAMMIGLDLFVNRSTVGKAMRAVAQDREAASMMGINIDFIISLTFFIGSALAGAGAVLFGLLEGSIGFDGGFTLGLFAFTAAVLGGIGNIRGAMIGGLIIGVIQNYVSFLGSGVGTNWYDTAIFSVLVLILVFRPAGILGTNTAEKV